MPPNLEYGLRLRAVLAKDLKPWLESDFDLPTLTVEYLSGLSNLSIAAVIKAIETQQVILTDSDGSTWSPQFITEFPPTQEKTVVKREKRNQLGKKIECWQKVNMPIRRGIQDIRDINRFGLNINPKRLIRQSVYQSRAPGGGPVVKAGYQEKNLTGQFNEAVKEKMKVIFVKQTDKEI